MNISKNYPSIPKLVIKLLLLTIPSFAIALLLTQTVLFNTYYHEYVKKPPPKIIPSSEIVKKHNNSLTYKLIQLEKEWNIADLEQEAKYHFDWFISKADEIEKPSVVTKQTVQLYFEKISALMNAYFIYEASTTLTEGLAKQKIDCDLRSYLFYDITQKAGLNTSVIYSPGHAFIAWESSDKKENLFWETTTPDKGKPIDLSNSSYEKSYDNFYYKRITKDDVIYLYSIIAASMADEKNRVSTERVRNKVFAMAEKHPNRHFFLCMKASYLNENSADKLFTQNLYKKILKLTPSTSSIHYRLTNDYYNHGNIEKAKEHFRNIKDEDKDFDIRITYAHLHQLWIKRFTLILDAYLYKIFWNLSPSKKIEPELNAHRTLLVALLIIWYVFFIYELIRFINHKNTIRSHGTASLHLKKLK